MSVSGLNVNQSIIARDRARQAALLGLHHASELHYTQDARRWEGINQNKIAAKGEFPQHADCSSFATWCLWNALHVPFNLGDSVNGENWRAGFTGTLATHGRLVRDQQHALRGDLVLYGHAAPYDHVAIVVYHSNGKAIVVSNGSEGGPYLLPYDYRSDVAMIRRYI